MEDAANNSGSEQNTGYSEYWKANNIYDLDGNVYEWTQERYSIESGRAVRGGSYTNYGGNVPIASRFFNFEGVTYNYERLSCQLLFVAL